MSPDGAHPLSLDGFLLEVARRGGAHTTASDARLLLGRLTLDESLIEESSAFRDDTYARNLVCRSAHVELLVLCWRPGQETTIHDHGGSVSALRVISGTLTVRTFTAAQESQPTDGRPADGPVSLLEDRGFGPGELASADRHQIHQLANESEESLVTLHLYAPPLREINVYSSLEPRVLAMRLRHTFDEDLG